MNGNIFKAISDQIRRKIIELLKEGPKQQVKFRNISHLLNQPLAAILLKKQTAGYDSPAVQVMPPIL